jgi:hypothetical protein
MKKLFLLLVVMFAFMMTANAQMSKASVDLSEVNDYRSRSNINAVDDVNNPDNGYPSISELAPGTTAPTIGELKRRTIEALREKGIWDANEIEKYKHTLEIVGHYRNNGREAWTWSYGIIPDKYPNKMVIFTFRYTKSTYYDGTVDIQPKIRVKEPFVVNI